MTKFKVGDRVRYVNGRQYGDVIRVFPKGIGAGDPGPSYRVRWDNGSESLVTRHNLTEN